VKITQKTGATLTGLRPGDYQATVMPVNFKEQTGRAAKVTFTVP
jgi:predicted phage tail protein